MLPDAECLKIMCEIMSSLQIGDFLVKVRAEWSCGGAKLGLASPRGRSWFRGNRSVSIQHCKGPCKEIPYVP